MSLDVNIRSGSGGASLRTTTAGRSRSGKIRSRLLALFFPLALFGYDTIAPILNKVSLEGATGSIILRATIIGLGFALIAQFHLKTSRIRFQILFPMYLFLTLYTLRLIDNFFIQEYTMYVDPMVAFGIFFGSGILPAMIIAQAVPKMDDRDVIFACSIMTATFVIGMALNYNEIAGMLKERTGETMLPKLNAISLSSVASSYAIFFVIMGKVSGRANLLRLGTILILLGFMAISRSRGPLVATLFAIGLYFVIVTGQHKKQLFRIAVGLLVTVPIALMHLNIDLVEMAFERFTDTGARDSIGTEFLEGTGRIGQWTSAWQDFLEYPMFGDKIFETYLYKYPHNLFLESLISIGLIGSIFLAIYLRTTINNGIGILRLRNATLIERFSALMFFKYFIQAQFSGAIWGLTSLWVASACVIALAVARGRGKVNRYLQGGAVPQTFRAQGSFARP